MLKLKTEKISKRVTRIFAFTSELMYLVEGDEKAALLDTGSGLGSLSECVKELTDKPVIVLITHGHVDHALGAAEFSEVYMNRNDDYIFNQHVDMAFRKAYLSSVPPEIKFTDADIVPPLNVESFSNIRGGDSFDLGGVTVDVYDCPGHTRGSVVFLIREERSLLLGDACNPFTFMFDDYSTTITEYEKSLHKLLNEVKGKYDTVFLSHGDGNGHKDMIEGVIKVCEDIRSGNTEDIPFTFMGRSGGFIAKAVDSQNVRIDGGIGNIIYNKDRI